MTSILDMDVWILSQPQCVNLTVGNKFQWILSQNTKHCINVLPFRYSKHNWWVRKRVGEYLPVITKQEPSFISYLQQAGIMEVGFIQDLHCMGDCSGAEWPWDVLETTLSRLGNGPLTRYVKLRIAHAPGMPWAFSPPLTSKETAS